MKFIAPLEISAKIMTLIEDAEKELIIVSPYVELSKWEKMRKCLERAVKRNVKIKFIARKNAKQDLSFLRSINIEPILVNDLHAKLYLNDTCGIVTSQNMIYYSDVNSIDIAYQTETKEERKELVDFVNKYVSKAVDYKNIKFNLVNKSNYENKIQLDESEVQNLFNAFNTKYKSISFKKTSSYVFCSELLTFADVMIDTFYTIKIDKSRTDCNSILEKIESINYEFVYDFRVELLTSHKSFYYIEFIPIRQVKKFEIDILINDFLNISECILNSGIDKIVKRQKRVGTW